MKKARPDLRIHLRLDGAPEDGRNPACLTRRVPVRETRDPRAVDCAKCRASVTYSRLVMALRRSREG